MVQTLQLGTICSAMLSLSENHFPVNGAVLLYTCLPTCPTALLAPFWMTASPGCSSTYSSSMRNAEGGLQDRVSLCAKIRQSAHRQQELLQGV